MITKNIPLSMAESSEYVGKDDSGKETSAFIKKFTKMKAKDAKNLREKIRELDLMKINESHISKIIDFLPDGGDELNKVIGDANLDEDEIKKVLETTKEFR